MRKMKRILAALLAALLLCSILSGCKTTDTDDFAVAKANYPTLTDYSEAYDKIVELESSGWNNWADVEGYYDEYSEARWAYNAELEQLRADAQAHCPDLTEFSADTIAALFADRQENTVYSPVNLYLALAMLAESTAGDTRAEITALLGTEDSRTAANALWKLLYQSGRTTSLAANSMWTGEIVPIKQSLADTLAEHYYADSFTVPMGTADADKAMQSWLNEHTGNLLKDAVETVHSEPRTILSLMSTLYFKAMWSDEFRKEDTYADTFTKADGTEVSADFMHEENSGAWHKGEHYTAVSRSFQDGTGRMLFILPDEGFTPEDLLTDPNTVRDMLSAPQDEYTRIKWSVPRFDVSSNLELTKQLQSLGVTKAFDPTVSDFTPATEAVDAALSQVQHAARVTIDEYGCTAAAFTVMMVNGAGMPPDSVLEFDLDRPFLFMIINDSDLPLFVGTVYEP